MARRKRLVARGRFEALEQRQLLAGDVVASVVNGELTLQGDALDNKIVITAGTTANSFLVKGVEGTTVHLEGEAAATEITVTDVRSARVELGEGNDLVAVVGAELRGNLYIDTEAGNDRVRIGTGGGDAELATVLPANLSVTVGSLRVETGSGEDQIAVDNALVQGRSYIDAGTDNDIVSLGAPAEATIVGAGVTDTDASVRLRNGVYVDLGAGNDTLNVDRVAARGAIAAIGGAGDNTIHANHVNSFALVVYADGGVDSITLENIHAQLAGAYTGGGSDHVTIRDSAFSSIGVALGDGDDVLTVSSLQARNALFVGGLGQDTLEDLGSNDLTLKIIRQFEIPPDINTPPAPRRPGLRPLARSRLS